MSSWPRAGPPACARARARARRRRLFLSLGSLLRWRRRWAAALPVCLRLCVPLPAVDSPGWCSPDRGQSLASAAGAPWSTLSSACRLPFLGDCSVQPAFLCHFHGGNHSAEYGFSVGRGSSAFQECPYSLPPLFPPDALYSLLKFSCYFPVFCQICSHVRSIMVSSIIPPLASVVPFVQPSYLSSYPGFSWVKQPRIQPS